MNEKEYPDPAIPTMKVAPDHLTGPLQSRRVAARWAHISHTKYTVGGWDVDPGSIEAVES